MCETLSKMSKKKINAVGHKHDEQLEVQSPAGPRAMPKTKQTEHKESACGVRSSVNPKAGPAKRLKTIAYGLHTQELIDEHLKMACCTDMASASNAESHRSEEASVPPPKRKRDPGEDVKTLKKNGLSTRKKKDKHRTPISPIVGPLIRRASPQPSPCSMARPSPSFLTQPDPVMQEAPTKEKKDKENKKKENKKKDKEKGKRNKRSRDPKTQDTKGEAGGTQGAKGEAGGTQAEQEASGSDKVAVSATEKMAGWFVAGGHETGGLGRGKAGSEVSSRGRCRDRTIMSASDEMITEHCENDGAEVRQYRKGHLLRKVPLSHAAP